jgi:GT2 family glycosyltransferase
VKQLAYSLIIPAYELAEELDVTLAGVAAQTRLPAAVIVVDSSTHGRVRKVVEDWHGRLPTHYLRAEVASAAAQRNQGARAVDPVSSPLICFLDVVIALYPDSCAKVCEAFEQDDTAGIGGIALRIDEIARTAPTGVSWWYYRLQAGYGDPTYGGRLFGPAINCLPCYTESDADLIPSEWLNSGAVFYRAEVFLREFFPTFEGYSFMEDVHLSARIAKSHRLYFHKSARCQHRDGAPARPRDDLRIRARLRTRNRRLVASDVLGLRGPVFELKLLLHRVFDSVAILRSRGPGWRDELIGTWI